MPPVSPADGPVAVTGVSGFTGGHMVRELVVHGYRVHACLRSTSSDRGRDAVAFLKALPNVTLFDGCDLFTPGSFDAAFAGCSAVFAVAAVLGNSATNQPTGSGDVGKDVYDGGMVGMQNVISAVDRGGTVKRVVYTSSVAAVMGPSKPEGHEWAEADWASDGVDAKMWNSPAYSYAKSKVDTERMINQAAQESGGRWDAVSMVPAMICGPLLFRSQSGQWIEQIGRMAGGMEPRWPSPFDMYYNIIDVRDLVQAHRLAAESAVDHAATAGGPRYILHGTGGQSAIRFGTDLKQLVARFFPSFTLGAARTVTKSGKPVPVSSVGLNDCKKAKKVLGVTIRPVEETIRDCVETSITLGLVAPTLLAAPASKL
mmetsp:Transcript_127083/g.359687  ORF Transcript_127083/g.359687 Transcript_127083/m.359687 type:complete len:371 (-) Transcript_127083:179-1291(-)